ncbi:MAG: lactate utilization protein [Syntrophomonadaceae bacterium]|nr:lactate utilization protein [Syntrophomonadaceae bacterium]
MWTEMKKKGHELRGKAVVAALEKNGFSAYYAPTVQDAKDFILSHIQGCDVIGLGGSVSLRETGLVEDIKQKGCSVLDHWQKGLSPAESAEIRRRQFSSDVFLTGSNAVTMTGELVNVDGSGNRVAAMCFGPKKTIVLAGINKVTKDIAEGINRSRQVAAVPNAARLGFDNPCVKAGKCMDCNSAQRICNITTIIHKNPHNLAGLKGSYIVVIVGEDLGF